MSRWLAEVVAVAAKDLRAELRTRVALNALALFALTTLAAVSYTIGPFRLAEEDRPFLLAVLLWIVILFAALAGLDRSFVKEEESRTAPLLRLAAAPSVVWAGKLVYNLCLIVVLTAMLTPLFCVLMGFEVALPWRFAVLLAAGGLGLAVITTIIAAIIAQAMTRGALFSVLSLPLLLPLVIFLIQGTTAVSTGDLETYRNSLRAVLSMTGVMTIASAWLFPLVWRD
ncbi:MAG: heme exporter protein CcmB [Thermoanaerobaculales bacterium]|jgi:heme exporter protein B|nr:heme exporter protein CcmB [Thermoanaerobaculales bacterium]